jgi:type 1 glutamine amidotransferase
LTALSTTLFAAIALAASPTADDAKPVKMLIITGDTVAAHKWKETTPALQDFLSQGGRIKVDVTTTPGKDLTDENLAKYDVLLLNYKDTPQGPADTKWSDDNKKSFLAAVHDGGKGLVVYHHASSAFVNPNWDEFEKAIAGGWRKQGFHGPMHEFKVKKTDVKHPITNSLPSEFEHVTDELYSNSMLTPGSVVLATALSDPKRHPAGTDAKKVTSKDEAVIWVNSYGKGRVFECALGHDVKALSDPYVQKLLKRGSEWAATGKVEERTGPKAAVPNQP